MITIKITNKKKLEEITHHELGRLRNFHDAVGTQENDIFASRNRILLPFVINASISNPENYPEETRKFLDFLLKVDDINVDLENKTIKTGKFPNGLKIMKFIDRILNKKEETFEVMSRLFDLEKVKKELELTWTNATKSTIYCIATRFPIDVARMSDHAGLRSCHSVGGDYYKCAVQESAGFGFVVYGVNQQITQEWLDENQNKEIFSDSERYLDGLKPIVRGRCRYFEVHFSGEDESDVIYTLEKRYYGNSDSGEILLEKLLPWLQAVQADKIKRINYYLDLHPADIEFQRIVDYSDTDDDVAIQQLLGREVEDIKIRYARAPELDVDFEQYTKIDVQYLESILRGLVRDWEDDNIHDLNMEISTNYSIAGGPGDNRDEYIELITVSYSFRLEDLFKFVNNRRAYNDEELYSKKLLVFLKEIGLEKLSKTIATFFPENSNYDYNDFYHKIIVDCEFSGIDDVDDVPYSVDLLNKENFALNLEELFDKVMEKFDPHGKFEPTPPEQQSFDFYDKTKTKTLFENRKIKIILSK